MFNHACALRRMTFDGPESLNGVWTDVGGGVYDISLSWTNDNANYYTRIYRKPFGGAYSLIHTANPGATSYVDTTALDYTDYEYYAVHYDGLRESVSQSSDSVISRAPRLTSASAASHTDGACPGTAASNLVSWDYTGTIGAFTVSVYLSRNGGASTLIASDLAPTPKSYEHFLTSEYNSGAGSSYQFLYSVELKAGAEQATDSPLAAGVFSRNLDPCGV